MVNFKEMIVLLVGMLEVCTANPIGSEEENNLTKLLTADELQRAKIVGLPECSLVDGLAKGFTLDEMIKLSQLEINPSGGDSTFEFTTKICKILVSGFKMTSNYTEAQADDLKILTQLVYQIPEKQYLPFVRTQICGYVSQPDSFGPMFVSLIRIHLNAMDILSSAEHLCCVNEGGDSVQTRTTELSNEEIHEFNEIWNSFDLLNVQKSTKNLCDFLHSKNTDLSNWCVKASVPVTDNAKK